MAATLSLTKKQREILADNCYDVRLKKGWNAEEVAAKLGKSKGYVYQLEAGGFNVPLAVLLKLREIYKIKTLSPLLRGL